MAETSSGRPRAVPVRRTFVPVRRSKVDTLWARNEFAHAVSDLVAALSQARSALSGPDDEARLRDLVLRARRALNVADEKLLMLDRRRHRSMFRRSERLRDHLDDLHYRLACYYIERTFDEGGGQCQTDLRSPGS